MHRPLLAACLVLSPALAFVAAPATAHAADFLSGPDVMRICTSGRPAEETACNTYIAGSLDQIGAMPKGEVCRPASVSLRDLRGSLARYGQSHSSDAKAGGSTLMIDFLKASYPCKS